MNESTRVRLWEPSPERVAASQAHAYQRWLSDRRDVTTSGYAELWQWSVEHLDDFWESVWEYFEVIGERGEGPVREGEQMPAVTWFPGAWVNYAENLLRHATDRPDEPALVGLHEGAEREVITWAQLVGQVGALARMLRAAGVSKGDTVCAVLPHIPQTVVAMLATTSIGAVWSVVSPDFGLKGIADRFAQIEPKVLFTVDGYDFNGAHRDMTSQAVDLLEVLTSVTTHVLVDQGEATPCPAGSALLSQIVAEPVAPEFAVVDFSHPLWVLYSSGTTGQPKGIVHSHGGVTLEGLKASALQYDIREGDPLYFAVSTAWVVWNLVVNGMLRGATVITYDGAPTYGTPARHLEICAQEGAAFFGTGAAVLTMIETSGIVPKDSYDLSALRSILSTGSPLPDSTWDWVYASIHEDVRLGSDSGGTDIASGFIGSNPFDAVYRGELMGAYLGVDADAFDAAGRSVVDEVGEFVVKQPMPSMPVKFWGDPDGRRLRASYFEDFPGVWRHGDWVTRLGGGQYVIHGRSDSTINRGGIRMGSADICSVVDAISGIRESMVIGVELAGGGYHMPLFVVPDPGVEVDDDLRSEIVRQIRLQASPRHVPDEIHVGPAVPRTRTGKIMEIPVKRVFQGAVRADVNRATASNPDALDWYLDHAERWAQARQGS